MKQFSPAAHRWFTQHFDGPTDAQRRGWPVIASGQHCLITAPTGSGKTLAAFLWAIDRLLVDAGPKPNQLLQESPRKTPRTSLQSRRSAPGQTCQAALKPSRSGTNEPNAGLGTEARNAAPPGTRVLYLSPLKALVVDIERNLRAPLAGITQAAAALGTSTGAAALKPPEVAIRTGDTPARERQRQLKTPAEILVTTPESLYLILGSQAAATLSQVETVIVDEVHALAPTKRGAHLALSLERLSLLVTQAGNPDPQRIGLSATVQPLAEAARWLGGDRAVEIVDAAAPPRLDLRVSVPVPDMERPPKPTVDQRSNAAPVEPEGGPILGELFAREQQHPSENRQAEKGLWSAIHPALLAEIMAHRSTIVFVNSRRLCERLSQRLNALAAEPEIDDERVDGEDVSEDEGFDPLQELGGSPNEKASEGFDDEPGSFALQTSGREPVDQGIDEKPRGPGSDQTSVDSLGPTSPRTARKHWLDGIEEPTAPLPELVRAHHGSVSHQQRTEIEEGLKRGSLKAIVATSSLEMGIDMGGVDQVLLVESPGSVARGLQRVGRAGHGVGEVSTGRIFPKYRGDLLECAVIAERMLKGELEPFRIPRNALDVLAQQLVAHCVMAPRSVDELLALVNRAGPYRELSRAALEAVLDMLSGRYPSSDFADLRPLLVWDRSSDLLSPRKGAPMVTRLNAGTIPDRGLYAVHLGSEGPRIGELDEEMVFETRAGECILLGASTWRVEEISRDRVIVSPAPGEPGKLPFWRGDGPGRPVELGRAVGAFCREVAAVNFDAAPKDSTLGASGPPFDQAPGRSAERAPHRRSRPASPAAPGQTVAQASAQASARASAQATTNVSGRASVLPSDMTLPVEQAATWIRQRTPLDAMAADNLAAYIQDQREATGQVPSDRTIVVERFRDELGDWRICILSPFGARIHAPWAMALQWRLERREGLEVQVMYTDDGIVLRLADGDELPDLTELLPDPDEIEDRVTEQLADTALFASLFRENAGRALLLPRRSAKGRQPLWAQRLKAQNLLAVVRRYPSFPIVLETYRQALSDVFDLPGLKEVLSAIRSRAIRVHEVETRSASPFARSLVFAYVAAYIYEQDAPIAERRAQALTLDRGLLAELLGEAELRALIDPEVLEALERELQHLTPLGSADDGDGTVTDSGKDVELGMIDRRARDVDELQDLLRRLGDLTELELLERCRVSLISSAGAAKKAVPTGGASEGHADARPADSAASSPAGAMSGIATGGPARAISCWLDQLRDQRRAVQVRIAGEPRWIAAEDAGLYRDALGCVPPAGLPDAFIGATEAPMEQLLRRYARTHGPFTSAEPAHRFGLRAAQLEPVLRLLESQGTLVQGEIRPSGTGPEWCDAEVMRQLRRRTLARARDQVAPVDGATLGRFLPAWHGIGDGRKGPERLLEALIQLEGLSLSWRQLDRVLLPARVPGYRSEDLDLLAASGQIIWVGRGAAGPKDGRVAIYRPEHAALALGLGEASSEHEYEHEREHELERLAGPQPSKPSPLNHPSDPTVAAAAEPVSRAAQRDEKTDATATPGDPRIGAESAPQLDPTAAIADLILGHLSRRGACFLFELQQVVDRAGSAHAGLAPGSKSHQDAFETALWDLVWAGRITNDTFAPLRSLGASRSKSPRPRPRRQGRFGASPLSGSTAVGGGLAGGRWSLVKDLAGIDAWLMDGAAAWNTERLLAQAQMLLERYGVLSREAVAAEDLPGGFGPLYRVLKQMEEVGQVRRGYFVEGLSGAQFALPAAIDRLRAVRRDEPPLDGFEEADVRILAAIDPANPYGALLPWPEGAQPNPKRIARAWVILVAGKPIVYVAASGKQILTFPDACSDKGNELELALAALRRVPSAGRKRLLIQHIDGLPALESPLREALLAAGFEADYDALAPARFASDAASRRRTGRDASAVPPAGRARST